MLQDHAPVADLPPADFPPETVDAVLEQVLASRTFERVPALRELLIYLWQHRGDEISEYAIATEALRRRPDFEPRFDATVRVLVSRLRKRLKEFYDEDGSHLSTRIVIPVGTHQIKVIESEQTNKLVLSGNPEILAPKVDRPSTSGRIIRIQFVIIVVLMISTGWLLWQRHQALAAAVPGSQAQLPVFWRQFLGNGKNTRIIVPNPVFFSFGNGLQVRDVHVNHFSDLKNSSFLAQASKELGKPTLSQFYVAAADAFTSLQLEHYLDSRQQRVAISSTAETPREALDQENIILAGNPHTLAAFQPILDSLSFEVDSNKRVLTNRQPVSGEPREIGEVSESNERIVTPGIIASLPGTGGAHLLVLLTTYHTSALISYLTSDEGLRELEKAQETHGHCQYFQAAIVSEINGTTPLGSRLAIFRPNCGQPSPAHVAAGVPIR